MAKKTSSPKAYDPTKDPLPADAPYFYSLTLENIRCFADKQTLDLSDGKGNAARWTVILGENGTGKTTLLQLLAMLEPELRPNLTSLSRSIFPHYFPKSWLDKTIINKTVFDSIIPLPNKPEIIASFSSEVIIERKIKQGLRTQFFNSRLKNHPLVGSRSLEGLSVHEVWAELFKIFAFGAKRKLGNQPWEEYRKRDATSSLYEPDAELINVAEWLRNTKLAATMSAQPNQYSELYLKIINLLKSGLLPDVDDIDMQPTKQSGGVVVTFHTPDGWIPLESLGLGYQTMIAWTVDFAARMVERYPDSPQPLHEPAIVLVDELDLHLHPRWQREIIGFLTKQFPQTQFIVTAHSPLVVQAAQDVNANIVLLRREGDHVVIDQDVAVERNLRVDQLLTSDVFGLNALRSPDTEKKLSEQRTILSKSELTAKDKQRLKELDKEIGSLPTAENAEDRHAMELIRRAAELLEKNGMIPEEIKPKDKNKRKVSNGKH